MKATHTFGIAGLLLVACGSSPQRPSESSPATASTIVVAPAAPSPIVTAPQASSAPAAPRVKDPAPRGPARGSDRDRDGIPDASDLCPDDPEDLDGFEDNDGCPDPDNDQDGIPDVNDKCPNMPETINGFEDEDGCPDVAPTRKKP